jgi:hypothetical protein
MLGSQQSTAEDADIDMSKAFDTSSTQATLYEPTRCIQDTVKADLELIATYLAKERAPSPVIYSSRLAQFTLAKHLLYTSE